MKIAVIADSHDNLPNIEKAIGYINKQKISVMIHCGDVCAPVILGKFAELFKGEKIHVVKGNVDGDIEGFKLWAKKYPKIIYHGNTGKLEIACPPKLGERRRDKLKIVFCHEPLVAKKMAQSQKYDFVFHGHTHKPWQEQIGKTTIINPGTLAGLFNKATFAIFDTETKKAQLILLEKI
ncbi:MAG: YfcE family phosphodiesterase [Candidatus Parcubacteria bacterium]|nr:YfcE family phosphodiesterase [Candidatus Parcubacteria bacterium]